MAERLSPEPVKPRVTENLFLGFMWAGIAVSFTFVVSRILVRLKAFRRIWWDDFLVISAWSFFLASGVIWQTKRRGLYNQYRLASGTLLPTPKVLQEFEDSQKGQLAVLFMFYSCLWAIKLSFLIFFRRLGARVTGHRIWWWCVSGFAIITYITCIGTIQYRCLAKDAAYIFANCSTPGALHFQDSTFHYLMAIDIITDCSIISPGPS